MMQNIRQFLKSFVGPWFLLGILVRLLYRMKESMRFFSPLSTAISPLCPGISPLKKFLKFRLVPFRAVIVPQKNVIYCERILPEARLKGKTTIPN